MPSTAKGTGESILVTGGAGYIGSHVVRQLLERGENVVVLDDLSTGFREGVLPDAVFYEGNVGNPAMLDKIFASHKIRAVTHFAACLVVPESVSEPAKYYGNNTLNTFTLIQGMVRHKVKQLVFSSSAATYGQPERVPVDETAPLRPESPYGWSKAMSERMIQDFAYAYGLGAVLLRYFNVAGADPKGRQGQRSRVATQLIKVASEVAVGKRTEMVIYGTDYPTPDGSCIRDYIHVEDLADAHLMALDYLKDGRGAGVGLPLNCGYGHGSSVREVVTTMKEVSGIDFKVTYGPRRPGDPAEVVADASKIRHLLGWTPRHDDLKEICRHALAWERKLVAQGVKA